MTNAEMLERMERFIKSEKRYQKRKLHRKLQGYEFQLEHEAEVKNQITFPKNYNPERGMIW